MPFSFVSTKSKNTDKQNSAESIVSNRLSGLVVTALGYRSRGPGFDSRNYQMFLVVGLEWGSLSLLSTIEELLERKVAAPVQKAENTALAIRHAHHVALSIRKIWH
jgi:hypothetical protein